VLNIGNNYNDGHMNSSIGLRGLQITLNINSIDAYS